MNQLKACIYRAAADLFPTHFFDSKTFGSTKQQYGRKVLIACSHFWPSIGGVESRIDQFASELVLAYYDVSIITPDLPDRISHVRNGVSILGISADKRVNGLFLWPYAVRAAITSGQFDVCIIIQDPRGEILWSVEKLPSASRTRVIMQPIITDEGYSKWEHNSRFRSRLGKLLQSADVAVTMTRTGPDVKFMLDIGLSPTCIPNATNKPVFVKGFRKKHGIDDNAFLILHVANLWWYKNHIGLIDALNNLPDSWKLVLIGNPTAESECARAVEKKLSRHPKVLFISGLGREAVSDAMAEADVFVLSSFGEGSPNTILEAMAHGRPWLATPHCGAANDNAGGIVCPLSEFMVHLAVLQDNPDLRRQLGEIGYQHWESCCSWPKVIEGWIDLIETGGLRRNYVMPSHIAAEMALLRISVARAIDTTTHSECHGKTPQFNVKALVVSGEGHVWHVDENRPEAGPRAGSFVNIGMITYNRLEFTRQAIDALQSLSAGYPFILTVVDNASSDATREYLQDLKNKGVIENLVLLDTNVGVAKASNLAWSLEPHASYYLKLDNDIVIQKSSWIGNMVAVYESLPEAGAVAYNFEPKGYPLISLHGVQARPKLTENLGGACIMIPKRTHERLGFWCEDYGLYGEEDADYCARVHHAGLFNIYMEDEEVGFHLPSGRAAKIGFLCRAQDGIEEFTHAEYRTWKDKTRRSHARIFKQNISKYLNKGLLLYVRSDFVEKWNAKSNDADYKAVKM